MTTYITFVPSLVSAPAFDVTLDGAAYNITVTWSLFGQRYYVNCLSVYGELVFSLPLIGSRTGLHIQNAEWANGTVTITTDTPHGHVVGSIVNATITGMSPDTYNGTRQCMVINRTQITFPLASYPGAVAVLGKLEYNVNLAAGYFNTSTLVYRTQNQTFEVTP